MSPAAELQAIGPPSIPAPAAPTRRASGQPNPQIRALRICDRNGLSPPRPKRVVKSSPP